MILLVGITIFCDQGRKSRPLNSHGFTTCHKVSLLFSGSHGRFFVSHGFTNCGWISFQTHSMKTNKDNKISCQKIFYNFVILDSGTATRSYPGNGCPQNYQKFYRKHLSGVNLINFFFSLIVFAII